MGPAPVPLDQSVLARDAGGDVHPARGGDPMTPHLHIFQPGFPARVWGLLKTAAVGVYSDNCLGIAKGVAYSGLLSFFPVLTTLAALLVQARASDVSHAIA